MTHKVVRFGHSLNFAQVRDARAAVKAIRTQLMAGRDVFVRFRKTTGIHGKRAGSIARVVTMGQVNEYGSSVYPDFQLTWDGRKNVVTSNYGEVEYLEGYAGPTVWKFESPKDHRPKVKKVFDRLGTEIAVGDFVAFAFNTSGDLDLMLGKVSRITDKGDVYTINQRIGEKAQTLPNGVQIIPPDIKERLIKKPDQALMVMTNDVMDRILMLKLAQ